MTTNEKIVRKLSEMSEKADSLQGCFKLGYTAAVNELQETMETERSVRGYWILDYEDHSLNHCHCSVCGHGDIHSVGLVVPHCWFCGSEMEKEARRRNDD